MDIGPQDPPPVWNLDAIRRRADELGLSRNPAVRQLLDELFDLVEDFYLERAAILNYVRRRDPDMALAAAEHASVPWDGVQDTVIGNWRWLLDDLRAAAQEG